MRHRMNRVIVLRTRKGVCVSMVAALLMAFPLLAADTQLDVEAWMSDIDFIVSKIESNHPKPWYRISEEEFKKCALQLKAELSRLDEEEAIVGMMQLVASIRDGHTILLPIGHTEFSFWYPIRIDRFADGFFVTAVAKEFEELLGSKVLRMGRTGMEDAFARVASIAFADSRHAWPKAVPPFLSNAAILRALDIVRGEELRLTVETEDDERSEVHLPQARWQAVFNWTRLGFRVPAKTDYVSVIDMLGEREKDIPLHLRRLESDFYWFEFLQDQNALYMQYNCVFDQPEEPFEAFTQRLWAFYEEHSDSIETFILDLRYNDGGNGDLLQPLIKDFVKHEKINQRGRLYCIVGPGTFSAATRCLGEMIQLTDVISLGEATAGPLNWCSDTEGFLLPHSGLYLAVSSLCWQRGHPSDTRGYFPPDYAVPATAADLFAGKDRALDVILSGEVQPLSDVLRIDGADKFWAEYEKRVDEFPDMESWFPFTEFQLRQLGLEMLQKGRSDEAAAALELNTVHNPDNWRAWQTLADCYRVIGSRGRAIQAYESSLAINPDNTEAQQHQRQLGLLQAMAEGGWEGMLEYYLETRAVDPRAFGEHEINELGYSSLRAGRTEEAIDILRINIEMFPESSNAWDSYAEAYATKGDNRKAVEYYRKSLELNPANTNAADMLEKIAE